MNDESPTTAAAYLTIGQVVKLATDSQGIGPSSSSVRQYTEDGLLQATRDSTGRLLFKHDTPSKALAIYKARKARHGNTGPSRRIAVAVGTAE